MADNPESQIIDVAAIVESHPLLDEEEDRLIVVGVVGPDAQRVAGAVSGRSMFNRRAAYCWTFAWCALAAGVMSLEE